MLSIDIGSRKVCVIEGLYQNDKVIVQNFGEIEYKNEVTINGEITDRSTLSFIINEIIKTNHMKSNKVIFTFNSSDIITREFKLPDIKPQSLSLLVKSEMGRIIGSESDYIIDYIINSEKIDKLLPVTAYAVPISMVESYFTISKELKLMPLALDIHANSISKLFSKAKINNSPQEDGNIIVADIGYSKISFHGFTNGICRFNRTETSPLQEYMREVGNIIRKDITTEDMMKFDFTPDVEWENQILFDVSKYFISRVADEILRYIQYVTINSASKAVAKVYICGGITLIKGFDLSLSNALKISVETIQSVDKVEIPKNCNMSKICNAVGALIRV